LMHRHNKLAVLATCGDGCKQIYPRRGGGNHDSFEPMSHALPGIMTSELLGDDLTKSMDVNGGTDTTTTSKNAGSSFASALSTALCIINRQVRFHPELQSRIMVTKIAKDYSPSYNSIMNSIFSADKLNVPVDSIVLSPKDSLFLQQASFLTKGVYLKPQDQGNLLQLLLTHCVSSSTTRKLGLYIPKQEAVDFRASCFCHRKPVEFAYMCSVCLAITCDPADVCATCSSQRAALRA
jgi:transcription initiation factor TFIIH subunit 3